MTQFLLTLVVIISTITHEGGSVIFSPLIPFTRGLTYDVSVNGKFLGTFHVPAQDTNAGPSVLAVYPTADTLPENLLKVYIHFSQPMREGQSQKYVHLLNGNDTTHGAFLNLEPELWNEESTVLTLWLDPGRIKRDLKRNLQLGAPLSASKRYRIVISRQWQNQQLTPLTSDWERAFTTTQRDSLSPIPHKWALSTPKPPSSNPLTITFGEPLDHELLLETFFIDDPKGSLIRGTWQPGPGDRSITFIPSGTWKPGIYTIRVSTKLEDLAGNNLNRPFERDMGDENLNVDRALIKMTFEL